MKFDRNRAARQIAGSRPGQKLRRIRHLAAQRSSSEIGRALTDDEAIEVRPTFVLSSGRSGTAWLADLFRNVPGLHSLHEPHPRLSQYSVLSMEDRIALDPITIRVARDHLVGSALRTGSHYLETSNSLAPLAPLIPQAYPRTQFIVLHRHPRDFIVSGLRRSFYREGLLDHTRLRLQEDTWDDLSQVEKIALLWEMTYAHIDVAVRLYPHVPVLEIKAEDMWTDPAVIGRIAHFLDVPQPRNRRVARSQRKPVNAQTSGAVGDVTANEIEAAIATHCTSAPARGYEN